MAELVTSRESEPLLVAPLDVRNDSQSFIDGREGSDRWGNVRKNRIACGTGWGEDEYVCPAYVEESCVGDFNPGTRWMPNDFRDCDLACGRCGGGDRDDTISVCGQQKGSFGFELARAELGGSFRMDRRSAPAVVAPGPWPVSYAPTTEWGGKSWLSELERVFDAPYPMIFTTVKTAFPGKSDRPRTALRDRLGGYEGKIGVNGLVKDGLLDDAWDGLDRMIAFCQEAEVHTMVTGQISYYDWDNYGAWLWNLNRGLEWYRRCVEAGFPVVALDCAPWLPDWLHDDRMTFIQNNGVKALSFSYQTMRNLHPLQIRYAQQMHSDLDDDVTIAFFGCNTLSSIVTLSKLYAGRSICFSNVEPHAKAAFFRLLNDSLAPPAWSPRAEGHEPRCQLGPLNSKGKPTPCSVCAAGKRLGKARTFAYNVEGFLRMCDLAQAKFGVGQSEAPGPDQARGARSRGASSRRPRGRARRRVR